MKVRVYGDPKGQPRPRAYSRGGKAGVYDPGTADGWKQAVAVALREEIKDAPPLEGPLFAKVAFLMKRPGRLKPKKHPDGRIAHTSMPDIDNLLKAVFDAATDVGAIGDDRQIIGLSAVKVYCNRTERPGAELEFHRATVDGD